MATPSLKLGKGMSAEIVTTGTLVIGSGAAGLNCAVRLARTGYEGVSLATARVGAGTSNNSGSDKQTYYKMGIAGDEADSPMAFARTLTAGGMCHGDLAYIEGVLSPAAFFHLCEIGVPFPHDRLGTYVGYKTDHDPLQRGTSAGPKTSHFMVQCLLQEALRAGVEVHDRIEIFALLTGTKGEVIGAVGLDLAASTPEKVRLIVFNSVNVVLATGGPGELYGASVYPAGQTGAHGLALRIGAEANNLTDSQFGLGSTKFRWNLSGTYQQVVPDYFSTDAKGKDKRHFMPDYFDSMAQMATAIFLKGYQWPFHAARLQDMGSSIVDMAVRNEIAAGRRVFMDFTRNPTPRKGMKAFAINDLEPEARDYLIRSGATQKTPYARLKKMNPESIDLYAEHNIDLRKPLEAAVNFQHNNGGLVGDIWWETTVPRLFAIGETNGSHGVRPGGSALNSGQVGGIRAAQKIANVYNEKPRSESGFQKLIKAQIKEEAARVRRHLDAAPSAPAPRTVRREIQAAMDEGASFIRSLPASTDALRRVRALAGGVAESGQRVKTVADLQKALQNEHLCVTAEAFLESVAAYIRRGGGSRGAFMVLDDEGELQVSTRQGAGLRHRAENQDMRNECLTVRRDKRGKFRIASKKVRPLPPCDSWYETTWRDYVEGKVFR